MKQILFSLVLLAVAFGAPIEEAVEEAPIVDDETNAILAKYNLSAEAVKEFFAANLNEVPFNPHSFATFKNWTTKWNVEIPELVDRSNALMVNRVQKEIAVRIVHFFARLALRTANLTDDIATLQEFAANSNELEMRVVDKVAREVGRQVEREWGLATIEGAKQPVPEPEAATDDDQDNDEEGTDAEDADDEKKDEGETTDEVKEGAEEPKDETDGDDDDDEDENTDDEGVQKVDEEATTEAPVDEDEDNNDEVKGDEESTTGAEEEGKDEGAAVEEEAKDEEATTEAAPVEEEGEPAQEESTTEESNDEVKEGEKEEEVKAEEPTTAETAADEEPATTEGPQ